MAGVCLQTKTRQPRPQKQCRWLLIAKKQLLQKLELWILQAHPILELVLVCQMLHLCVELLQTIQVCQLCLAHLFLWHLHQWRLCLLCYFLGTVLRHCTHWCRCSMEAPSSPSTFFLLPSSFFLLLPPSSSPDLICQLLIAVGLARSHLPALDSNGPRRTSSASSWSQWASPDLICQLLIAVGLAGPHLPALDSNGPRRTSFASSWSQWASPDLICQLLIAVGLAGPHLPALDRGGPRRTSSQLSIAVGLAGPQPGESLSAVGLAGPQPARFGALHRRTLTGEIRSAVGLARPQPARFGALWASPDLNRTSTATNKAM